MKQGFLPAGREEDMLYFDPLYFIVLLPTMALSLWASWRVRSTFQRWSQYQNSRQMSGAEVARLILDRSGCSQVAIEHVPGNLSDHYDPAAQTLRLSDDTYNSRSIAAAGVAAHEAGHAIQDKVHYPMLRLRTSIVGFARIGSWASWILIGVGTTLMFYLHSPLGYYAMIGGVIFFSATVFFQLVTVPVEINASSRAKEILRQHGFASGAEIQGVEQVLNAAAWTYVAAAIGAVAQLLYFLLRLGLFSGSTDD
ncbi:MAG: zinc metallopeptidase [Leptospiraceae bacterium]|nr:zinc metallopeptidase [Leptospiraceae bacterium]